MTDRKLVGVVINDLSIGWERRARSRNAYLPESHRWLPLFLLQPVHMVLCNRASLLSLKCCFSWDIVIVWNERLAHLFSSSATSHTS